MESISPILSMVFESADTLRFEFKLLRNNLTIFFKPNLKDRKVEKIKFGIIKFILNISQVRQNIDLPQILVNLLTVYKT